MSGIAALGAAAVRGASSTDPHPGLREPPSASGS